MNQMALHLLCKTVTELVRVLMKANVQVHSVWQPQNIKSQKFVLVLRENVKYSFSWPNNLILRNFYLFFSL